MQVHEIMAVWDWLVSYADWDIHWLVLISSFCRHTSFPRPS